MTGGSVESQYPNEDYTTIAYDASTGATVWVKRYKGPGDSYDIPTSLGVSPDGTRVFVTGASDGPDRADYATVAYDASTGAHVWVARYDGPASSGDGASSLGVSPDGANVFVTGASLGPDGADYATVAYDASTGAQVWVERYDGPDSSYDAANSLGVSPDGARVFVTGSSVPYGDYLWKFVTIAYDGSTGRTLWVEESSGPVFGGQYPVYLAPSPDGAYVFVTGGSQIAPANSDWATIAYDASTGAQVWADRYDGPGKSNDVPGSVGVSPDGAKVFVTGGSAAGPGGNYGDYATIAYSRS